MSSGEGFTRTIIVRLETSHTAGFDNQDQLLAPITDYEARRFRLSAGETIPEELSSWALRCLNIPLIKLVEQGYLYSGRTLARIIPQLDPAINMQDLNPEILQNLYTGLIGSLNHPETELVLCPRCGTQKPTNTVDCQACKARHSRVRRLWNGAFIIGVGSFGAIGVALAVALGASGDIGSEPAAAPLVVAYTCDQQTVLNKESSFTDVITAREICFTGDGDHVDVKDTGSADFGAGNFSISLWVNFSSLSSDQTLLQKMVGIAPEAQGYSLGWTGEALWFFTAEGDASVNDLHAPATLVTGSWHHVVAVFWLDAAVKHAIRVNATLMRHRQFRG